MVPVSAIKLIRTDTTLDLSQKAEKGITTSAVWSVMRERLLANSDRPEGMQTPRGSVALPTAAASRGEVEVNTTGARSVQLHAVCNSKKCTTVPMCIAVTTLCQRFAREWWLQQNHQRTSCFQATRFAHRERSEKDHSIKMRSHSSVWRLVKDACAGPVPEQFSAASAIPS
jgi:hypothetical protein